MVAQARGVAVQQREVLGRTEHGVDDHCMGDGELPQSVDRLEHPHHTEDPVGNESQLSRRELEVPLYALHLDATLEDRALHGHDVAGRQQPSEAIHQDEHSDEHCRRVHERLQQHRRDVRHDLACHPHAVDRHVDGRSAVVAEDAQHDPHHGGNPKARPRHDLRSVVVQIASEYVMFLMQRRCDAQVAANCKKRVRAEDQAIDHMREAQPQDEQEHVSEKNADYAHQDQEAPTLHRPVASGIHLLREGGYVTVLHYSPHQGQVLLRKAVAQGGRRDVVRSSRQVPDLAHQDLPPRVAAIPLALELLRGARAPARGAGSVGAPVDADAVDEAEAVPRLVGVVHGCTPEQQWAVLLALIDATDVSFPIEAVRELRKVPLSPSASVYVPQPVEKSSEQQGAEGVCTSPLRRLDTLAELAGQPEVCLAPVLAVARLPPPVVRARRVRAVRQQ
mmetsp:Transcript_27953/g.80201  ORF Transcript_27953/g.80201 Transcript_27953/m.80201 type:complete len:448 (-) Transcript_27953:136-1479(-)